jgi:maleylacetoacetate isomerase
VTLADICLVPQLRNAEVWKVDTSGFPRTLEIGARLLELPAFRDTHPDRVRPEGA